MHSWSQLSSFSSLISSFCFSSSNFSFRKVMRSSKWSLNMSWIVSVTPFLSRTSLTLLRGCLLTWFALLSSSKELLCSSRKSYLGLTLLVCFTSMPGVGSLLCLPLSLPLCLSCLRRIFLSVVSAWAVFVYYPPCAGILSVTPPAFPKSGSSSGLRSGLWSFTSISFIASSSFELWKCFEALVWFVASKHATVTTLIPTCTLFCSQDPSLLGKDLADTA